MSAARDPSEAAPALSAEEALKQRALFLIGAIANKLVINGSAVMRQRLGLGFTEYRIMVMLWLEPGIAAKRISEVVGLDKAAISRGLGALEAAGLIEPTPETAGRRSQAFRLTAEGHAAYARGAKVGREHERLLMGDLSEQEQQTLIGLLQRLHARTPDIEAFRPETL